MLILAPSGDLFARICNSTGNGHWNHSTTWSCAGIPQPGDTVNILAGHTIIQSNNQTYSGAPLHVNVYGVWQFSGGGSKISLPCGSYVEIHEGGSLFPDPSYQGFSETVRICNITYWNTTMGPQEGYVIWPGPPSPLPVELISFEAISNNGSVRLNWTTAQESDIAAFGVHRSMGEDESILVGTIEASGSTSSAKQYLFSDVPPSEGLYYYHLHEIRADGGSTEMAVTTVVHSSNEDRLRCVPNPLNKGDLLHVDLPAFDGALDARIIGLTGQWMHPLTLETDRSLMVVLDGLPIQSGMYMLQVVGGGTVLGTCRFRLE